MWGWVALAVAAAALLLAIGAYGRALRLLPQPSGTEADQEWKRRTDGSGFWLRVKMISRVPGDPVMDEVVTRDHQCVKPLLGAAEMDQFAAGSIWRCNCGKVYTIARWLTPGGSRDFIPEWIEA